MASKTTKEREKLVLKLFSTCLTLVDGEPGRIERFPDLEKHGGCEAIILRKGARWATEHTTIESYENQRASGAIWIGLANGLQRKLGERFPSDRVTVTIDGLELIASKSSPARLSTEFQERCLQFIATMEDSRIPRRVKLESLPFEFRVRKESNVKFPGHFVMDICPEDLDTKRVDIVRRALSAKRLRLATYKRDGYSVALILDGDDVLTDIMPIRNAVAAAWTPEDSKVFDEVFAVEGNGGTPWIFPVRLRDVTDDEFETMFRLFMQRQMEQGWSVDVREV